MKKLLLITLSTILALNVFAKTDVELVKEFYATAKNNSDYVTAKTIVTNNAKDVEEALKAFVKTDYAKTLSNSKWTTEEKQYGQAMRMLLGQYLYLNQDKIKELPLVVACVNASTFASNILAIENPNFYSDIKTNNFTVDGFKLPPHSVINLALANKDYETIIDYTDTLKSEEYVYIQSYIDALVLYSVNTSNYDKAQRKIAEVENIYILRNREIPTKLTAVAKLLTRRMVESKVRGK